MPNFFGLTWWSRVKLFVSKGTSDHSPYRSFLCPGYLPLLYLIESFPPIIPPIFIFDPFPFILLHGVLLNGFFLPPDFCNPGSSNIKIFGLTAGFSPVLSLICHVINLGLLYVECAAFIFALGVATWHSRSLILPHSLSTSARTLPYSSFSFTTSVATLSLSITLSTPSIMIFRCRWTLYPIHNTVSSSLLYTFSYPVVFPFITFVATP